MKRLVPIAFVLSLSTPADAYAQRGGRAPADVPLAGSILIGAIGVRFGFPTNEPPVQEHERLEDGTPVDHYTGSIDNHGVRYGYVINAASRPLGGNALETLTDLVEETVDIMQGDEIRGSRAIWYQGYPGADLDILDDENDIIFRVRLLVGRQRTYAFHLGVPVAQARAVNARQREFFDSVLLDPADAPSTAGDGRITTGATTWLYPPEGYFAVEVPGVASRANLRVALEDHDYNGYRYTLIGGTPSTRFDVMVLLFTVRSPDDPLATMQAQIVGPTGHVRSSVDRSREGYASRELVVDADDAVRTVLLTRTTDGIYAVIHTVARADEAATRAACARFFSTFRILRADP